MHCFVITLLKYPATRQQLRSGSFPVSCKRIAVIPFPLELDIICSKGLPNARLPMFTYSSASSKIPGDGFHLRGLPVTGYSLKYQYFP